MANEDIVKYLKEGQKRGFAISLLKKKLLEGGFSKEDVNDAVAEVDNIEEKNKCCEDFEEKSERESKDIIETGSLEKKSEMLGKLGFFGKIGRAISSPTKLFEKTSSDGIGSALGAYYFTALFPVVFLGAIFYFMFDSIISSIPEDYNSLFEPILGATAVSFALGTAVLFLVVIPICLFILSTLIHMFAKLYGGEGNYAESFKAMTYGRVPANLFFFIFPISALWCFIVSLFGISVNHKISKWKAFFVEFSVVLLLTVVFLGIVFVLIQTGQFSTS